MSVKGQFESTNCEQVPASCLCQQQAYGSRGGRCPLVQNGLPSPRRVLGTVQLLSAGCVPGGVRLAHPRAIEMCMGRERQGLQLQRHHSHDTHTPGSPSCLLEALELSLGPGPGEFFFLATLLKRQKGYSGARGMAFSH